MSRNRLRNPRNPGRPRNVGQRIDRAARDAVLVELRRLRHNLVRYIHLRRRVAARIMGPQGNDARMMHVIGPGSVEWLIHDAIDAQSEWTWTTPQRSG